MTGMYPAGTIFSDSIFQDRTAQALAERQVAENRAGEDWNTTEYGYGYGAGQANPYSQLAMLNRQQNVQRLDQKNQAASRPGSVRSGAYQIRNANLLFDQGGQQDALRRSYDQASKGYVRQKEDIVSGYNTNLYNSGLDSLQRALTNQPQGPPETETTGGQPTQAGQAPNPMENVKARYKKDGWQIGSTHTGPSGEYTLMRAPGGNLYKVYKTGVRMKA